MSDQVIALCRAGYYQLCELRPVARSLPEECAKTLVQAFISSRLHYCNALFYGISDSLFRRLAAVDPECGGAPSFAPLTPMFSLFREQTLDLATGVSRLLVREYGTVYPPHCGSLTLNFDTLNDF